MMTSKVTYLSNSWARVEDGNRTAFLVRLRGVYPEPESWQGLWIRAEDYQNLVAGGAPLSVARTEQYFD